jgi:hypothetical protein
MLSAYHSQSDDRDDAWGRNTHWSPSRALEKLSEALKCRCHSASSPRSWSQGAAPVGGLAMVGS